MLGNAAAGIFLITVAQKKGKNEKIGANGKVNQLEQLLWITKRDSTLGKKFEHGKRDGFLEKY